MDQQRIVSFLDGLGLLPELVQHVQGGYDDFDAYVADAVRVTVEAARAKFVSCRIQARLRLAYGETGPRRMIDESDRLTYLLIEGNDFDVGIRAKKLNKQFLSYNHRSRRQDKLRQTEQFFGSGNPRAHVFLGYGMREGLEPALTVITLSSEFQDSSGEWKLSWLYSLWNEAEGTPLIRPIQPDIFPPPPRITPRLPAAESEDGTGSQGG